MENSLLDLIPGQDWTKDLVFHWSLENHLMTRNYTIQSLSDCVKGFI